MTKHGCSSCWLGCRAFELQRCRSQLQSAPDDSLRHSQGGCLT
jgi:hypothetical protein